MGNDDYVKVSPMEVKLDCSGVVEARGKSLLN